MQQENKLLQAEIDAFATSVATRVTSLYEERITELVKLDEESLSNTFLVNYYGYLYDCNLKDEAKRQLLD